MRFDEQAYYEEMATLLANAKQALVAQYPDLEIYTISIWTDPDAAVSAVNFDTYANSAAEIRAHNRWAREHYERLIALGDLAQAKLFLPMHGRSYNPADFALSKFTIIEHSSFEHHWEEESQGACWDGLEPALRNIGEAARKVFHDIHLHRQAELGVNGRSGWYSTTWLLG